MALTMRPKQGLAKDGEVDFDATWNILAQAFEEIHNKNASKLSYEELYRHGYKLVLKKRAEELYAKVQDFEQRWLTQEVLPQIQHLVTPSIVAGSIGPGESQVNERRLAGERFMRALKDIFEHHTLCMCMITDVLMYMVRLVQKHVVLIR